MCHRIVASLLSLVLVVVTSPEASAWFAAPAPRATAAHTRTTTMSTATQLQLAASSSSSTRSEFLQTVLATTGATTAGWILTGHPSMASAAVETLENGVTYEVIKKGNGPKPEVGELIAIRFAAYNGPIKIDDVFDTPEPYYTRVGSGGLIKGVEQTLPLMRLGDRWKLTIPVRRAKLPCLLACFLACLFVCCCYCCVCVYDCHQQLYIVRVIPQANSSKTLFRDVLSCTD